MKRNSLVRTFLKMLGRLTEITLIIAGLNFIFSFFYDRGCRVSSSKGKFFDWKLGRIFYTCSGEGRPVLLLHGIEPDNSSEDFKGMIKELSKTNKVYAIDLLGFGNSDRPWITYTNYIYVCLIRDFIKDVIGDKNCDIVATEGSCLLALQAHKFREDCNGKLILINPCRGKTFDFSVPTALKLKRILEKPIFGTLLYNFFCIGAGIRLNARGKYVLLSRLSGHLASCVAGHEELIDEKVSVIESGTKKTL